MRNKEDPVLGELQTIRKLLLVALLKQGLTQAQLGAILGVDRTMIGKMFPSGALATLNKKATKGKGASGASEAADG